MADIEVTCGFCGYNLSVDESKAGGTVECPGCKRDTFIPKSPSRDTADEEGPRLQSARKAAEDKQPATVGKQKQCPVCGGEVPQYAIVCRHCGYDWRTGEFSGKARLKRLGTWLIAAGIVIGLAIVGWVGWTLFQPEQPPALVDISPPPATEETDQAQPEAEPATAGDAAATATEGPTDDMADRPAMDTGEAPMDTVRVRVRDRVALRVDRRYPRFTRDEEAALRLRNGLVHRGQYLGVKDSTVVLIQEDGSKEVPLDELDRATRLRCDPAFRDRFIDFQTKRYMQRVEARGEATQ